MLRDANRTGGLLSKKEYKEFEEYEELKERNRQDAATQSVAGSRFGAHALAQATFALLLVWLKQPSDHPSPAP